MTHREFMRALASDERRSLTEKNNMPGVLRFSILVLLLLACSLLINSDTTYGLLFLLPQGLLLISLFHLLHECIHDTVFQWQPLNMVIGSICGFLLFIPSEWFRYFHRDHHRYTQIKDKDPELATAKPQSKMQWLRHVSGIPVFISQAKINVKLLFGQNLESFVPDKAKAPAVRQVRISLAIYAIFFIVSIAIQSGLLFWIWLLPLVIGQPFLRLYLLAEHTSCDHTDNMFKNTRTMLCNPVIRWFTWNMPYHTEHHVYPAVPFHQLPTLHKKMQRFLVHKEISYTEFNRELYTTLDF